MSGGNSAIERDAQSDLPPRRLACETDDLPVWLDDVQVYPDAAKKRVVVRANIGNITGEPAPGQITIACESCNVAEPATFEAQSIQVKASEWENIIEFTYQPGGEVSLWDEFQPALLRLDLTLETRAGGRPYHDRRSVTCGMRDFTRERNRFMINGRRVFLRGRIDCCFTL